MIAEGRWENYLLLSAERLGDFWTQHLSIGDRRLLFILGRGFDPRVCLGLAAVAGASEKTKIDVDGLEFLEGERSPSKLHQDEAKSNWAQVQKILEGRGSSTVVPVNFWSADGRRIGSQSAREIYQTVDKFESYSDVVIDVSSMPRSVYFPLIARVLYLLDGRNRDCSPAINLHVLVAEDPGLDSSICEQGIDEKAEFMSSFGGAFDEEAIQTPKIWLPMIGEGRLTQFARINDRVKPDEICPVLPSPSRDPRRGDNIVIEYQSTLFDQHRLDGRNFLFVSEQNPFEVYRRLLFAIRKYFEVFEIVGGCRVAISALSSKLMSLGALLVAYELKTTGPGVGIAHIESQGYTLGSKSTQPELFCLWLAGDCDVQ